MHWASSWLWLKPRSAKRGALSGMANTAYTYTLDGPEDKMTATYTAAAAVTGRGSGLTVQAKAVHQTFTDQWTRIDHCEATP